MNMGRKLRARLPATPSRHIQSIIRTLPLSLLIVATFSTGVQAMRPLPVSRAAWGMQRGKITDPKVAATRLYDAWRRKSRTAALQVADRETVNKLFGVRWRAMQAKGCERRDEGGFQCVYYDAKNDLSLAINVSGGASSGYGVESVSFSTEE